MKQIIIFKQTAMETLAFTLPPNMKHTCFKQLTPGNAEVIIIDTSVV